MYRPGVSARHREREHVPCEESLTLHALNITFNLLNSEKKIFARVPRAQPRHLLRNRNRGEVGVVELAVPPTAGPSSEFRSGTRKWCDLHDGHDGRHRRQAAPGSSGSVAAARRPTRGPAARPGRPSPVLDRSRPMASPGLSSLASLRRRRSRRRSRRCSRQRSSRQQRSCHSHRNTYSAPARCICASSQSLGPLFVGLSFGVLGTRETPFATVRRLAP